MKYTGNYNLKKPDGTDVVNIQDLNDNMDIIDTQLKSLNDDKVQKETGKGLSSNDFTTAEKNKLAGLSGNYNDLTNKPTLGTVASKNTGTTNGTIPVIGADNKLDASILPALAITDTFVVNSQASMLALTAQIGDVCVRTDINKTFILKASPATTLANWQELLTPADAVLSVNGKTGAVSLGADDVGAIPKTGGTFTGDITFSEGKGIKLGNGGKLVDQVTEFVNRTALQANGDSFEVLTENGTDFVFTASKNAVAPTFKRNIIYHSGYQGHGTEMNADMIDGLHGYMLQKSVIINGNISSDPNTTVDDFILTDHVNAPKVSGYSSYWYVHTHFFSGKSDLNSRYQVAVPYFAIAPTMFVRYFYNGWSAWKEIGGGGTVINASKIREISDLSTVTGKGYIYRTMSTRVGGSVYLSNRAYTIDAFENSISVDDGAASSMTLSIDYEATIRDYSYISAPIRFEKGFKTGRNVKAYYVLD
ncbi:pyocin knob domain-containing protein [Schinkia azotoformans]|uniref:Putative bacteriophage tail fiber protein n=1 Tax=Schinkia azotoformans LMG 9581 TaxID=1131731 RepID=K6DGW0_SCHAZ|nr:pyocin knob domain-containing protein [Schinkia azotoformans]EKN67509.1 putative bacteriophage tail fiber protein [Schinkia azotoformans LMG 9581]MEC1637331.1 pyocin knob domain-containing protein [Schinkia azotoformans]MEC1943735.1 pyocin knob domain-containing protein [Schinkia azotoformans]